MTPLFKKLNFKNHVSIVAINAPASFDQELAEMQHHAMIIRDLSAIQEIDFVICFATTQTEVDTYANTIHPKLRGDAVIWFCYPKGTSKKYKCDFNRDTGWEILGQLQLEPVRVVAIDNDWSALRFRKVSFIKTITRRESFALTTEAKARTTQKDK